jgi:outer membrane lipoprotein-sorting protein
MNDIRLLPPPALVATASSSSTIITGHASMNTSEQLKKKNNIIKDLGDQVVPQSKRGTERPVIEHNEYDQYGRFSSSAPVLRYRSSNNNNNNNNKITINDDLLISQTNSHRNGHNIIVLE